MNRNTLKSLRRYLGEIYGILQYRITANGEVHVYGTMPNTNEVGWYLLGYTEGPSAVEFMQR